MSQQNFIHATLVDIEGKGILIKGKSQSGKSDLALRLISRFNAELVADDIVNLSAKDNKLIGSAPENLAGMLEVRGVGIIKYSYLQQSPIVLIINLLDDITEMERMPKICEEYILGLEIPQIDLYAREDSAPDKVIAALCLLKQRNNSTEGSM